MALEVGFGELCIFYELPFCCSLNSCGGSPDGQRETQFKKRRAVEDGGSLVAGIKPRMFATSVLMIKLTSSRETLRETAEHR